MAQATAAALDYPFAGFPQLRFPTFRAWGQGWYNHFIPHEGNNYHPHILGHRFLGLLSMMLVVLKVSMVLAVAISPAVSVDASAISIDNVLTLTNADRIQSGLKALSLNAKLSVAAGNKAQALAACQCFSHNLPDGRTPWSFIQGAGYTYITAGENLAEGFAQAEDVDVAWMNSPGHRANILNKNFEEIGIGIASGRYQDRAVTFVVQMFGTPVAQKVALSNTPTPLLPVAQAASPAKPVAATPAHQKVKAAVRAPASAPVTAQAHEVALTPVPAPVAPNSAVTPAAPAPDASAPIQIVDTQASVQGDQILLTVTTAGPAARVIATFDQSAAMLYPKNDSLWQTYIPLAALGSHASLSVTTADMSGHTAVQPVASFSPSIQDNYHFLGSVKGVMVKAFGMTFDPHAFQDKFYLLIMAGLLASLMLAIAIRRHVQHMALIANGSFVVILACLLWMAG